MDNKFSLEDLEVSEILGSKFLPYLEEGVGEREIFQDSKRTLLYYLEMKSLDTPLIDFLKKHRCKIIVEVNRKEKAYLRDLFPRLSENKLSEEDKKFLKDLFLNVLKDGKHYFVILLSAITKMYPAELTGKKKRSFLIGKRFSNLLFKLLPDKELDDFGRIILKEPLFFGYSKEDVILDDLSNFLVHYGFTPSLFFKIHKVLIEDFTRRESGDIASIFKNTDIKNPDDLQNFPFDNFFRPTKQTLSTLAGIASKKASRVKRGLIQKDRELDDKDINVREATHKFLQKDLQELQSLVDVKDKDLQLTLTEIQGEITELEKALKLYIRRVQELGNSSTALKNLIDDNRTLLNITIGDIESLLPPVPSWEIERMVKEFWHAQPYIAIIDPSAEKRITQLIKREEKLSPEKELFSLLRSSRIKKFQPDLEKVISNYKDVFETILEPLYIRSIVDRIIRIWPPEVDFGNPKSRIIGDKRIHLVGLDLLPRGYFYRFSKRNKVEPTINKERLKLREEISKILRKQFSSLVSTLVYDIRGSTFMGHRLQDAEKEKAILSSFQSTIFDAARKGSSFILKDTGDGGVLWFGSNSRKLYRNIYKHKLTESGAFLRYSTALEDEFELLPHPKSAEMAIKTALNLVEVAEEFVRENYIKYREWFGEVTEKEIFHNGMTYALLPPQFKSLFRLGIGIASGQPGRDIIFTSNAFGDPDLRGILVDESALFSSGRSPERSVILIDHCTLINLLLNSEEYLLTEPLSESDSGEVILEKLLSILKWEEEERTFIFEDFDVTPAGIYYIDSKRKEKALKFDIPQNPELEFNEKGELVSEKGRVKILYEVLTREGNEE